MTSPSPEHRSLNQALLVAPTSPSQGLFTWPLDHPLELPLLVCMDLGFYIPLPSGAYVCAYNFCLGAEYPSSWPLDSVQWCPRALVPKGFKSFLESASLQLPGRCLTPQLLQPPLHVPTLG